MTDNLPSIPEKAKSLWRIVKAAGPLLIAQSSKLSEAYAKHQLRLAEVDAIKELMVGEARTITEIRKKLIERYIDATPEDRLRLTTHPRDIKQQKHFRLCLTLTPRPKPLRQKRNAGPVAIVARILQPTDDHNLIWPQTNRARKLTLVQRRRSIDTSWMRADILSPVIPTNQKED